VGTVFVRGQFLRALDFGIPDWGIGQYFWPTTDLDLGSNKFTLDYNLIYLIY
jgi:hypothetical protein